MHNTYINVFEAKIDKASSRRESNPRTPGLCSQCSATELRQPDNHQPSQSSIGTAQVVLNTSVAHLAVPQYVPLESC